MTCVCSRYNPRNANGRITGLQKPSKKPYNKLLINLERSVFTGKSQTSALPLGQYGKISVWDFPFSSPAAALLLISTKNRDLLPNLIFWACTEYSFRILGQSDLSDLTGSPWIADFRCWTSPVVAILGADQKQPGLWENTSLSVNK